MERTREANVVEVAGEAQSCDEWPITPAGVEPQVEISRAQVREPFFHVFDHDTVIAILAGRGEVELRGRRPWWELLEPGDFVYVPAGVPARLSPVEPLSVLRFTADERHLQACAWFCDDCGTELARFTWDASSAVAQEGFGAAMQHYANELAGQPCARCGALAEPADVSPFRWAELAEQLRSEQQRGVVAPTPVDKPIHASEKRPLHANVFERSQTANVQLVPLFPYLDDGAMVPGAALFRGDPGTDLGTFYHQNSVDEVGLCLAAQGAWTPTGAFWVNGKVHPVGSPLADPADPSSFVLMVVTQRQPHGEASEGMLFRCSECRHLLFKREYDASPVASSDEERFPIFPSQRENTVSVREFNAAHRVCEKCGHENARFPGELWGVDEYVGRGKAANSAYAELVRTAEAAS